MFDYADRYPQAIAELAGYLKDGRMKSKEDVVEGGVAAFPETLNKLFTGENFGKLVLRVAPTIEARRWLAGSKGRPSPLIHWREPRMAGKRSGIRCRIQRAPL